MTMIDDDTAINLSAMFFRIRTTAAYQEVGVGGGGVDDNQIFGKNALSSKMIK